MMEKREFDLRNDDLSRVVVKEYKGKKNCLVVDLTDPTIYYTSFLLEKNQKSKTVCDVSFYESSCTNKYIPRLIFKRQNLDGSDQEKDKIIIRFDKSDKAIPFWKLIAFLASYKDLVDVGEFDKSYKVVSRDNYILEFESKNEQEQVAELRNLVRHSDISYSHIKELIFDSRKTGLRGFFYLLKNIEYRGKDSHTHYREKYGLRPGEEYIWHHFLSVNDWILGLNSDLKFITDFLDETRIGISDSEGRLDPQVDMLGISDYTTLVELKHSNTKIFKSQKSKGRANTWDFSSDFIEGISQCLGQKAELEKSFDVKDFVGKDGNLIDKNKIIMADPKSILLIGNKKEEFPIGQGNSKNRIKYMALERFRRNNRNIDVLTYDELFERAYHIVFSQKLNGDDWYSKTVAELFGSE